MICHVTGSAQERRLNFVMRVAAISLLASALACPAAADSVRFVAVGWNGEFTHIDSKVGEVPPTHQNLPDRMQALAWSPDGRLYAGKSGALFTLEPATGEVSFEAAPRIDIRGLAFSPSGALYGTDTRRLYEIDPQSGETSLLGDLHGDADSAQGLDFSPSGELYAVTPFRHRVGTHQLLRIDLIDAEMHEIGRVKLGSGAAQSIEFTPDGRLFAVGDPVLAELNPENAELINTLPLNGDYRGLALVPEPTSLFLMLFGVGLASQRTVRHR